MNSNKKVRIVLLITAICMLCLIALPCLASGARRLDPVTISLQKKKSVNLLPLVSLQNGETVTSWVSDNEKIVTVNSKGVAKSVGKTGKAKINLKTNYGSSMTITIKVQSKKVKTKKLTINTGKVIALPKGEEFQLVATVSPISSSEKVTYSSTNKSVATVSSKGLIKAKSQGNTEITVKSGSKSQKVKLYVTRPFSWKFDKKSLTMWPGESKKISVTWTDEAWNIPRWGTGTEYATVAARSSDASIAKMGDLMIPGGWTHRTADDRVIDTFCIIAKAHGETTIVFSNPVTDDVKKIRVKVKQTIETVPSVTLKERETVSIDIKMIKGAYVHKNIVSGSISGLSLTLGEEWNGDTIPLTIKGLEVGNYRLKIGNDLEDYVYVDVTVEDYLVDPVTIKVGEETTVCIENFPDVKCINYYDDGLEVKWDETAGTDDSYFTVLGKEAGSYRVEVTNQEGFTEDIHVTVEENN